MKKRLFLILLAVLMIVSLLPAMAFAGEVTDCTYPQKVTAPVSGETYELKLNGMRVGWFAFTEVDGGWKIRQSAEPGMVGMTQYPYLAVQDGKLTYTDSENATVWTYKNGAFSTAVKTEQKSSGFWFLFWYIPGSTKTVTTTYYLSTVKDNAKLSTSCVKAELYTEVTGEHDYKYVNKGNGTHDKVCKNCNDTVNAPCVYDEITHKCVCGAYDPAESSVKISVDVRKTTSKQYVGWWFWGYWTDVTTYTATIKTEAKGVKVTKVQYQLNGGKWTTGTCVSSDKPIETLNVKAWDNNGKLYEYAWPEAPVPVYYNVTAQVQGDHGTATVKVGEAEPTSETTQAVKGADLVFAATPKDGYEFDHWEVVSGGITLEDATVNPITVTMPGTALTLKAHFKIVVPSVYNIIVEDDGHGTAMAQVGGVNVTAAAPETEVTLFAAPNEGYALEKWEIVRGLASGAIIDNTFTMPANEVKVKAIFVETKTVREILNTVDFPQKDGTIPANAWAAANGNLCYRYLIEEGEKKGENLLFTDNRSEEYVWLNEKAAKVENGYVYTCRDVSDDVLYSILFRMTDNKLTTIEFTGTGEYEDFSGEYEAKYGIIVEDDGHGTAKAQVGGEDVSAAAPGANVTLSATPNDGYIFKEWEIARGLDSITGNTFTMPSNEVKVKAIFERVYNITLQTNEHGTVVATVGGETATTAAENAEVTLTATPAEGYQFKEWNVVSGGVTVTDNKFTMPANNVTVQAVFEEASPTIRTIADVLATAESDFPQSTTEDDIPDGDAWQASGIDWTKHCCLTYDGNSLHFFFLNNCKDINKNASVSQVSDNYVYTDGAVTITFNMTGEVLSSIEFADTETDTWDGEYFPQSQCIAAGTMISMPGGKQKAVEELEIGDIICTFDHETGEVSSAPIAFIWESKNVGNAFTLTFEGDIEVTVIEEHGFYDKEEQKYVFINLQNAQEYIGDHFYDADTDSWLALKSCEALNDSVDAYAVITSGHLNHMSNGMLSMCDGSVKAFANIFEYDNQMKFDEDKKKADIEKYGLTPKEKILELKGFTEADYDAYNLQYVDVMIGKGLITWEDMEALSDYCVANGL